MISCQRKYRLISSTNGNVIRLVSENYIRNDIDLRLPGHSDNPFPTSDASYILCVDSQTLLQQIDALSDPSIINVLILQTSFNIVAYKSRSIQQTLLSLLSNPEKHFY